MPRTARKLSEMKIYHITVRGINKQDIFFDYMDRKTYLKYLKEAKEKTDFEIYAYCLMSNHVHILIKDTENNISKIMQSISIRYSKYFNKKYERVGHLFQNRYGSQNVNDDGYLLRVQKYIHQNPEIAGICKADKYEWSSYNEYIYQENMCNTKEILNIFGKDILNNKRLFKEYTLRTDKNVHIDYEMEGIKKISDDEAIRIIQDLCNIKNLAEISQLNTVRQKEYLIKLKECKVITAIQISRIIGINRKIVERIMKK